MKLIKSLRFTFPLLLLLGCVMPALAQSPGSQDTAFDIGPQTAIGGPGLGMATQPDGKILITTGWFNLRRYLPNGQLDPAFGNGGHAQSVDVFDRGRTNAHKLLVDPLGRIYVYGDQIEHYSSPDSFRNGVGRAIVRFLPNGALDTSFGTDGVIKYWYLHETNPSSPRRHP